MQASSVRYHLLKTRGLVLLAALAASASAMAAETETAQPPADKSAASAEVGVKAEASPTAAPAAPVAAATGAAPEVVSKDSPQVAREALGPAPGGPPWQTHSGIDYWVQNKLAVSGTTLAWHGNLETDLGYGVYTFSSANYPRETFNDFRGRFVLGPEIEHPLGGDYFVRATGQMVAWVRALAGQGYQITMDDVFGQVGKKGVWDLKFGRFMSWTVYRKGLGYDLYTLEDTGALVAPPIEGGQYGVRYEVNNIWYRDNNGFGPGRAALHLYPTKWSGIELLGQYGRNSFNNDNQFGGRAAANVHSDYASVSVGAEYLYTKPGGERFYFDANENKVACDTCGVAKKYGFGGGIVSKPVSFIELGVNGAMGFERQWDVAQGVYNKNAETTITAMGGYLQFDAGKVAFNRSVILGVGPNYTTRKTANNEKEDHLQVAGYVAYPLGFNNALVKLVITDSRDNLTPSAAEKQNSNVFAARIRFAMYY